MATDPIGITVSDKPRDQKQRRTYKKTTGTRSEESGPPRRSGGSRRGGGGGRKGQPPKPVEPKVDVEKLPADVAAEMKGMSTEDAAAYAKVQLTAAAIDEAAAPKRTRSRGGRSRRVVNKPDAASQPPASPPKAPPKPRPKQREDARKEKPKDKSAAKRQETRGEEHTEARQEEQREKGRRPSRRSSSTGSRRARNDKPAEPDLRPPVEPTKTPVEARPPARGQDQQPRLGMGREMVINSTADEVRIAILYERRLEEFFIERSNSVSNVGNIYKGIITNVEQSIQAAFIDFGLAKHGFLHISDVQPQYFSKPTEREGVGQKVPRRDRPPIQNCFRRGQEVIVQVIKEGVGTKGPTLTTYLSIPGSYLVMMPGMSSMGVSRKIEDEETRRTARDLLSQLELPNDKGFILRTAGQERTKRDLQRDLNYLQRLWNMVVQRVRSTKAPASLYRESDLVIRTIRDVFTNDFDRIIVDSEDTKKKVLDFLHIAMPRMRKSIVEVYDGAVPIFHHYSIEEQIEAIHARQVRLRSGGSIVIDQTEALVAIDVNSGKSRSADGEEATAYQTNIEAAREIARQLLLRDLGGLVVCDFIDMRMERHKRAVERELRDRLKVHKERARILKMSQFGLIEMTRQRQGPSIKRGIYADCPHCRGSGLVKTPESMTIHVLRNIQEAIHNNSLVRIAVTVSNDVAVALLNRKRAVLHQMETETGKIIQILSNATYTWGQQDYSCEDANGRITKLFNDPV